MIEDYEGMEDETLDEDDILEQMANIPMPEEEDLIDMGNEYIS